MSSRILILPLVLAVLAIMGVVAIQGALISAGELTEINGEEWTPDPGNWTELEHSNNDLAYYHDDVTVRDNNGDEVTEGDDYEWSVVNGSVKAVQGGALDGAPSAEIDYSFDLTTEEQNEFATLLAQLPRLFGIALPVFVVFILMTFLRT